MHPLLKQSKLLAGFFWAIFLKYFVIAIFCFSSLVTGAEESFVAPDFIEPEELSNQTELSDKKDLSNITDMPVSSYRDIASPYGRPKNNYLFFHLTTIHSSISNMAYGGDFGYGRNLQSHTHYFGFFELGVGLIGLLSPGVILKYGYVFMRKNTFSFGLNGIFSPVVWTNNWPYLFINEDLHIIYGVKLFFKIRLAATSDFLIRFGVMDVVWPLSQLGGPMNNQMNNQINNQMLLQRQNATMWNQWNNQQWANNQLWMGNQIWLGHQRWTRNFNLGFGIRTYF